MLLMNYAWRMSYWRGTRFPQVFSTEKMRLFLFSEVGIIVVQSKALQLVYSPQYQIIYCSNNR